jgi:NTE family protein
MDASQTPAKDDEYRPALVLGGGGAYGVIQAAYVLAAHDFGFRPQLVVGTSVGALNGAWVALNPDRPAELLRIWLGLDQLSLVRWHPFRIASRLVHHPLSLASNQIVPQLIRDHLGESTFDDVKIELGVVATNLTRGQKHVFRSGSLPSAILASTAIPGVFEPVEIGGDQFVDGCVTATVDMATALEMGATEILAIDLTPPPPRAKPRTALGVLKQSFSILSTATTRAVESCLAQQMPVRVIRPDLSGHSPWKLEDSAGAIAHNLRLAREELMGMFDADGRLAPVGTCWIEGQPGGPAEGGKGRGELRYFPERALRRAG